MGAKSLRKQRGKCILGQASLHPSPNFQLQTIIHFPSSQISGALTQFSALPGDGNFFCFLRLLFEVKEQASASPPNADLPCPALPCCCARSSIEHREEQDHKQSKSPKSTSETVGVLPDEGVRTTAAFSLLSNIRTPSRLKIFKGVG
ncbi:hypothetical protein SON66_03100 [Pseudomonas syringae]|uniref:hypothetical protein n=1 Tax=Pseudomonas syringae TaxID=317 RepID=UPI00128EA9CB|nr:hypothetical protein [Pseudomonas syringae]MCH5536868.1 hypothetical protein [Pseudomonas syringae pv. syringae]MDF5774796.1 hypothetical protein [Pseudomonas syringae pv. syringae]MDY2562279.1 hypothetical protein [Pseudomonas syringae]